MSERPRLSVVIASHDNLPVLRQCIDSWRLHAASDAIELLVIEDGCRDGTAKYLESVAVDNLAPTVRWFHEDDVHELACTNRGFKEARGELIASWQDDMFLRAGWFATEIIATFARHADIGLVCLSRGLNFSPCDDPVQCWADLFDERRMQSTIGPSSRNWLYLHEVDGVIRPWVVRRACIEKVGSLDDVFRPTEWDESDLCARIRQAGWKIAVHGYERLGGYVHLGSSTISKTPSEKHQAFALRNGKLFLERWSGMIRVQHDRPRQCWSRTISATGYLATFRQMARMAILRVRGLSSPTP